MKESKSKSPIRLVVKVSSEFRKAVKLEALRSNSTMRDLVVAAIEQRLKSAA